MEYFEAIKLLDREGFVNNKIHTILTIPRDVIYDSDLRPKMIGQIEMARQEAEKLDNKFALSTACHWMGIIMTHEGKKNEALFWYENCLHLRKELGESVSITKITNGLAYNNLLDSKYQISYDLINSPRNIPIVSAFTTTQTNRKIARIAVNPITARIASEVHIACTTQ